MAMFARSGQIISRRFSSHAVDKESTKKAQNLWKKLTYFAAFPAIIICAINVYLKEQEIHHHYQRPDYVPYEYLLKRAKRYPWGDGNRTLFHNPKTNALPGIGYEE